MMVFISVVMFSVKKIGGGILALFFGSLFLWHYLDPHGVVELVSTVGDWLNTH